MVPGTSRHQVSIHNQVLVDIIRAVGFCVADEVVVNRHLSTAHELGHGSAKPQAMTDDALDDVLVLEGASEELGGRRDLVDVFSIPEPICYNSGGHYYRRVAAYLFIAHPFEALAELHGNVILVTLERQRILAPHAGQEVEVYAFFLEAVLIVPYLVLVEVALNQDCDFFTLKSHVTHLPSLKKYLLICF